MVSKINEGLNNPVLNLPNKDAYHHRVASSDIESDQAESTHVVEPQHKSPLDHIAQEYWQDYINGQPIDNGVTFEDELRACNLDGTLDSLKRIDALLDKIQASNVKRPDFFMEEPRNRHFVLFVGFYMGRVLTQAWRTTGTWVGQAELLNHYSDLHIHPNNPFHFMALRYTTEHNEQALFFVLEPIAIKIFGNKLIMPPVIGPYIDRSLYDAVYSRLPQSEQNAVRSESHTAGSPIMGTTEDHDADNIPYDQHPIEPNLQAKTLSESIPSQHQYQDMPHSKVEPATLNEDANTTKFNAQFMPYVADSTHTFDSNNNDFDDLSNEAHSKTFTRESLQKRADNANAFIENKADDALNNLLDNNENLDIKSKVTTNKITTNKVTTKTQRPNVPTVEDFKALKSDLVNIDVPQENVDTKYKETYLSAVTVLNYELNYENNRDKNVNEAEREAAIQALHTAAEAGHSTAMLRLALIYFEKANSKAGDRGVNPNVNQNVNPNDSQKDSQKDRQNDSQHADTLRNNVQGFEWVQRAANKGDVRAQRQLSRLYYKGIGCEQNIEMGKQWLQMAADNGHPEAKSLLASLQKTQLLIAEKNDSEKMDRRYLIVVAVAIGVCILLAIFL